MSVSVRRFHQHRALPLAPHPLRGGTGETPGEGLISGCKAGPADLSVELTQEQRNSDREEENAFIPTVIDSFNHLLIQQVAATFLPQGRHCVQLKRGHSFTLPSNTRILLHPFFHLPLPHLARKAETRSLQGGTNDKPELDVLFVYHRVIQTCSGKFMIFKSK